LDGASSNAAIRKRIVLIAAERKLDHSETKALTSGRRISTYQLCQFVEKHHLSFDWLIAGHIKGRLEMARNEFGPPPEPVLTAAKLQEFKEVLGKLDKRNVQNVFFYACSLVENVRK
jgi:hypothetical protein